MPQRRGGCSLWPAAKLPTPGLEANEFVREIIDEQFWIRGGVRGERVSFEAPYWSICRSALDLSRGAFIQGTVWYVGIVRCRWESLFTVHTFQDWKSDSLLCIVHVHRSDCGAVIHMRHPQCADCCNIMHWPGNETKKDAKKMRTREREREREREYMCLSQDFINMQANATMEYPHRIVYLKESDSRNFVWWQPRIAETRSVDQWGEVGYLLEFDEPPACCLLSSWVVDGC